MRMFLRLGFLSFLLFLFQLPCFAAKPADAPSRPPVLLAISATSSSEDSSPLTCLLDPACKGGWTPQSEDQGVNEGIYMRFQEPTLFNFIEITVEGDVADNIQLQTFLDAQSSPPKNSRQGGRKKGEEEGLLDIVTYFEGYTRVEPESSSSGAGQEAQSEQSVYLLSAYDEEKGTKQPLRYAARSVFVKIASFLGENKQAPKITSIRFFAQEEYEPGQKPMELTLPVAVKAKAVASSTLEPEFAYDVSRLFDSQTDMAWSTNGKKNKGTGESITLSFDEEQNIAGLIVWNGYQRSDVHFRANGRVKGLQVENMSLGLKDVQGSQVVKLPAPLTSKNITFRINDIYPGGSYKDVLISELRLLTPDGRILLPLVAPPAPEAPASVQPVQDVTYASFLHQIMFFDQEYDMDEKYYGEDMVCLRSSMRLRGNGSFVIYTDVSGETYTGIVEGNWEPVDGQSLRLFGKRYAADLEGMRGAYLPEDRSRKKLPAPRIFQSALRINKFSDLEEHEQQNISNYLLQDLKKRGFLGDMPETVKSVAILSSAPVGNDDASELVVIKGGSEEEAVGNLMKKLQELDAVCVVSDVYTNVLLPMQKSGMCY